MMSVGMGEKPTAAELELETSMKKLTEAISRVPEAERNALAPVHAALTSLERSMEAEDHKAFVCSLVDLAEAVIEVRTKAHAGGGPLAEIPFPPYDLWLPFKADSLRTSDKPSPHDAAWVPPRNSKIGDEVWSSRESLDPFVSERASEQRSAGSQKTDIKTPV